jgi:hypothetical protein
LQILECLDDGHGSTAKSTTDVNNLRIAFSCPGIDTEELVGVHPGSTSEGYFRTLPDLWFNLGKILKDLQFGVVSKVEGRLVRGVRIPKLRERQGIPSLAGAPTNQIETVSDMRSLSLVADQSRQRRVCKDIWGNLAKHMTVAEVAQVTTQLVTLDLCLLGNAVNVHLRVGDDVRYIGLDADEKSRTIMKLDPRLALER